jgi:hypothetical protein
VEALDLRQVKVNTRGTGDAQYHHWMIASKMAEPFCLAAWRTKSDTLLGRPK